MRTAFGLLATTGVLAAIAAPAMGGGPTVKVSEYKFRAKTIHVHRGATVNWRWVAGNGDPHNVTFHGFHSKTQTSGSFAHTFRRAGTFKYVCTIHNKRFGMHGTVIVG
jgi:plastocyanin